MDQELERRLTIVTTQARNIVDHIESANAVAFTYNAGESQFVLRKKDKG